ncbi:probable boron transporter 2 isoform X1 [Magnolia sinica]|uniref:probable boron transporter 2 isoform X1 n=1 Tax=Magnolia sinica TaxID=86752 RepID=UPI0026585FDA|nr:probable boron transporter 2 isoform X1 [Magnolia sinica]
MIAVLYYFDHSVASQLAQQKEFNLRKPSSFHYDLLLLGFMVILCGLIGIPPSNGVIPQSPMHTKTLATLKHQLLRNRLVATARKSISKNASLGQLYGNMQEAYQQMQTPLIYQEQSTRVLRELKDSTIQMARSMGNIDAPVDESMFDVNKEIDDLLPVEVKEQRLSNLMQAMMVGGCVAAMPFLRRIPTSVLWGYFAFMAIESLPGNQFWERILLLFTAPSRRYKVLEEYHTTFVETVPFKMIAAFTSFQMVYLLICFGITWIPIAGVLFPLMIMLLVPVRQYCLPKFFKGAHLQDLDAAEYEEAPALSFDLTAVVSSVIFECLNVVILYLGLAILIIMYTFMFNFAKYRADLGSQLFLAWTGWVCVWTAFLLFLLAILGACSIINRFTRVAGELFGLLIAMLFMQQAIKGLVDEFRIPKRKTPNLIEFIPSWRFANGMFALVLSFGLLISALRSRKARSWRYGSGWLRGFIADYGVPLMVLVWTAVSYIPHSTVPSGIPRRLSSPNPWSPGAYENWTVIKEMLNVPILYIFGAFIPATMIAVLYYFDHSVASQLAQQKEFNLRKPSSFHYDLLLLGFMVILCGLIGIPPSNGVIPQSPMHTKTLATLKHQLLRNRLVATARKSISKNASLGQLYGNMQEAYQQMQTPLIYQEQSTRVLRELKDSTIQMARSMGNIDAPVDESMFDVNKEIDDLLPVEVKEQRLSNLMQAMMVGGCVAAMPFLRRIPTSVLWGYFAFMAIESLPGNQFWERILLLFTAPSRRYKVLEEYHTTFVETVPFKMIAAFTSFQMVYLLICFGITWIPIAGVLFPLMIMLLVPVRQYCLPKFFKGAHLQDLDAAEYEEAPALSFDLTAVEGNTGIRASLKDDGEILDEVITRSRGEIRRVCSPKVTSSSSTPNADSKALHSPRFMERAHSPRVNELRQEKSPRIGGKVPYSPATGESRPSTLGQPARHSTS